MQDVSKEWLDFRRNQFPAGSRIQTWELDDPRNTLRRPESWITSMTRAGSTSGTATEVSAS